MKILDFNMTRDYCKDWTPVEAWREIVQNCIDSGKEFECDADVEDAQGNQIIHAVTKDYNIPLRAFAIGSSINKNSASIGKYGEGLKLAMMVLTREGLSPVIYSGNLKVTGEFRTNELTGMESFCLVFEELENVYRHFAVSSYADGVNLDKLKEDVTQFAEHPLPLPDSVDILMSKPGRIYVNGLFVCDNEDLTFGYNFAPNYIALNRDRNMVCGVESVLGQYYVQHGNAESVFNMLINGVHDVSYLYIYISRSEKLKAELVRLFFNKYGEGARIGKPGSAYSYSNTISLGHTAYNALSACGIKEPEAIHSPESPCGILTKYFDENKKHMRSKATQGFNSILKLSKGWRV